MSATRMLEVWLGGDQIGHLSETGSICRFTASDAWLANPQRPTLSLCFNIPTDNGLTEATLRDPRNRVNLGQGSLPPYFANLLPEGALRTQLARLRGVDESHEFEILAAAGDDLPGAVTVRPAPSGQFAAGWRALPAAGGGRGEMASPATAADGATVAVDGAIEGAFSLAGVQDKLALSMVEKGRRYTLPTRLREADIIAKLPPADRPDMCRNEFSSMMLARAAGVNTAEAWLEDMAALAVPGLAGRNAPGTQFLAVRRFDRGNHGRVHAEDFCQALARQPRLKYANESEFVKAVRLLVRLGPQGMEDAREFLRRQVVNTLLGNTDAHLKNFSLLYPDRRLPTLSPAYDIVCVAAYLGDGAFLLNEKIDEGMRRQTVGSYEAFAQAVGVPVRIARATVAQTVACCRTLWPGLMQDLPVGDTMRAVVLGRLETLPLALLRG